MVCSTGQRPGLIHRYSHCTVLDLVLSASAISSLWVSCVVPYSRASSCGPLLCHSCTRWSHWQNRCLSVVPLLFFPSCCLSRMCPTQRFPSPQLQLHPVSSGVQTHCVICNYTIVIQFISMPVCSTVTTVNYYNYQLTIRSHGNMFDHLTFLEVLLTSLSSFICYFGHFPTGVTALFWLYQRGIHFFFFMCNLGFTPQLTEYFEHLGPTKMSATSIAIFSEGHEAHEK